MDFYQKFSGSREGIGWESNLSRFLEVVGILFQRVGGLNHIQTFRGGMGKNRVENIEGDIALRRRDRAYLETFQPNKKKFVQRSRQQLAIITNIRISNVTIMGGHH